VTVVVDPQTWGLPRKIWVFTVFTNMGVQVVLNQQTWNLAKATWGCSKKGLARHEKGTQLQQEWV